MRTVGQPISGQSPTQPIPVPKPILPGQTKPSTPKPSTPKKPEEKSKGGELDDVLKKLREMEK